MFYNNNNHNNNNNNMDNDEIIMASPAGSSRSSQQRRHQQQQQQRQVFGRRCTTGGGSSRSSNHRCSSSSSSSMDVLLRTTTSSSSSSSSSPSAVSFSTSSTSYDYEDNNVEEPIMINSSSSNSNTYYYKNEQPIPSSSSSLRSLSSSCGSSSTMQSSSYVSSISTIVQQRNKIFLNIHTMKDKRSSTSTLSLQKFMMTCFGIALTFAIIQSSTGLNVLLKNRNQTSSSSSNNDEVLHQLSQLKNQVVSSTHTRHTRSNNHRHLQQQQQQQQLEQERTTAEALKSLLEQDSENDNTPEWSFHYLLESSIVIEDNMIPKDDEEEDSNEDSNIVVPSLEEEAPSNEHHSAHVTQLAVGGQLIEVGSMEQALINRVEAREQERKDVRNMARAQALAREEAEQTILTKNLENSQKSTQSNTSLQRSFKEQQMEAKTIQIENDIIPDNGVAAVTTTTTNTPVTATTATSDGSASTSTTKSNTSFGDDKGMTAVSIGERAPQATEDDGFSSNPTEVFQYLKPLSDIPTQPLENIGDVILFWHVPKAAGSTLKNMLDHCYYKTRTKKIIHPPSTELVKSGNINYVNIETHLVPDIKLAKELHLLDSDLPEVFNKEFDGVVKPVYTQAIVASRLWEASQLFSRSHYGRMITILRHPVERAISMYKYLGKATWEPTYQSILKDMTLMDYATKYELKDNNWLVRMLTHTSKGPLSIEHVHAATEFLRRFCLIGFMDPDDKEIFASSIKRFEQYLYLQSTKQSQEDTQKCVDTYVYGGVNTGTATKKKKEKPVEMQEGSPEWEALAKHNQWDMMLWNNALEIYKEQGILYNLP